MALISKSIANLLNGVSQQPPIVRRESQGSLQNNMISHPIIGNGKRPPTKHKADLMGTVPTRLFRHTIDRDPSERYAVTVADGVLTVYDLVNNTFPTVNTPDGTAYLADAGNFGFSAVTTQDVTFIANRGVVTAMDPATSTARPPEAVVSVKAGAFSKTYEILIDDVVRASYATRDSGNIAHEPDVDTVNIATELVDAMNLNAGADTPVVTATRYGSDIYLVTPGGEDFTISTSDGFAGKNLIASKGETDTFVDLPTETLPGVKIKVLGDQESATDDYYVEYSSDDAGTAKLLWRETIAPNTEQAFDPATMPHTLTREADGTFTFAQAAWGDRTVGDADSSPDPSFIGSKINHVFFMRNRFGVLSGESVILSRGDRGYFEFFRDTVITVLDTDPIDVTSPGTDVSLLLDTVPYNEDMIIRSDKVQFVLRGEPLLTPKETSLLPRSRYETSPKATPVVVGNKSVGDKVYFPFTRGAFGGLWELSIVDDTSTNVADDVTEHVPNYIPGEFFKLSTSSTEKMIVGLATDDPKAIYVYQFLWAGNSDKLQSAWHRWEMSDAVQVVDVAFIRSEIVITSIHADGVFLSTIDVSPRQRDVGSEFVFHIDRRITEAEMAAVTEVGDDTLLTTPYDTEDDVWCVLREPFNGFPVGTAIPIIRAGSQTFILTGLWAGAQFYFGLKYRSEYVFSTIYLRETSGSGATFAVTKGRLTLSSLSILFAESGYFEVHVTPQRRPTREYTFTGKTLGTPSATLGTLSVQEEGTFSARIGSKNTAVDIRVLSDSFLPFFLTGIDWEATYNLRSRRV